jgi:predicted AlkP superfamily phosphohydrolase/phosphomutase
MMDTAGQVASMTGGYGNSYAQTAGQQAYQGYLQQLNDRVPELYQLALGQYNQEGQNLYDQASLMASMEDQDYGRYRDQLSDYYTDLNYLTENARYMSETEYQQALNDFNIKYSAYRDNVSDQQWQAQFDEAKRQYDQDYALSAGKSSGGGYVANPVVEPEPEPQPEPDPDILTYDDVLNLVKTYIQGGAIKSEIGGFLREKYNEGSITKDEYDKLKELYLPRGYTY